MHSVLFPTMYFGEKRTSTRVYRSTLVFSETYSATKMHTVLLAVKK